jgi:hypothetical protein
LSLIPSGFAQPEADAAAFRRTRQAPFIQRGIIVTWFRLSVNKNRTEWFITKTAAALIALAVGFAAAIGTDAFHIAQGPQDGATRLENWL